MAESPGPVVDLIDHAAGIIAAKRREPHTGPYHWAGALWEADLLHSPGSAHDAPIVAALRAVLAVRERELLELKGPCINGHCRLHYAHSGPCEGDQP